MALNKNHAARLRRVAQRLDKSLDSLMQANGELWPQELRPLGTKLQEAVNILQGLSGDIETRLNGPVEDNPAEPAEVDPAQTDVEDFEGVAQIQPDAATGRRRRT